MNFKMILVCIYQAIFFFLFLKNHFDVQSNMEAFATIQWLLLNLKWPLIVEIVRKLSAVDEFRVNLNPETKNR